MHFWRLSLAEYRALPLDLYQAMSEHMAEVVKSRVNAELDPWGG